MLRKLKIIFLYSVFISPVASGQLNIFSSDFQKGMRAYEKGNYKKAQDLFEGILKDNYSDAAASYGMALVCFTKDYANYSLSDAYSYARTALQSFKALDQKTSASLLKQGLDESKINTLKKKIDDELFGITVAKNTVEGYTDFISRYPDNSNIDKAKELKEQLSFFSAKNTNTETAVDDFIKKNPKSKDVNKAIDLRNLLAFQKAKASNSIDAIKDFIAKYPDAKEIEDAKLFLAELEFLAAKKKNTIEAFDAFMQKYPDAEEYPEASNQRNQLAYIQLLEGQKEKDKAELQARQAEIDNKNTRLNFFIAGSVMLLLLAGLLLRSYYQKKRSGEEMARQKAIIETKNKEIVDSINYAKRIQEAMLPLLSDIKSNLPESFVFYRPRDIVSGDFYWYAEQDGKLFIAAADCTGHGVPGALVSMIGFNFLNQLVSELNVSEPGKILDQLHVRVATALNREKDGNSASELRDGMDIGLLCIDKNKRVVQYAGAVRPLYYATNGEIRIIKGGIYSIGGIKSHTSDPFHTHEIKLNGKTNFYLFSDGYADQFGGENGKKFKMKKFQELLKEVHEKGMDEQHRNIESAFLRWMGEHEQVDDVCVIGLRV